MNLGIAGRWALICGSSKGLGKGCAQALAAESVNVVLVARGEDALTATATELRNQFPQVQIQAVTADITTVQGRGLALSACPQIDILVTNAAGPAPGDFRQWSRDAWIQALDANMLTPIELIKDCIDNMIDRGFGRIINITSGAVKAPIDVLGLSNGARSGLTGFVAGLARDARVASHGVTINNLLPGPFDTDRLQAVLAGSAKASGQSLGATIEARKASVPARRFGSPAEFGAMCAFLCSVQAGYINGQNILMDGGAYPGTF